MRALALAAASLLAVGCGIATHVRPTPRGAFEVEASAGGPVASPTPPAELACKRDADCDSTHYTAECCVVCGYTAGSREHIRKLNERCQANPDPKCPPYDCPPVDPAVACVKGSCRLKSAR